MHLPIEVLVELLYWCDGDTTVKLLQCCKDVRNYVCRKTLLRTKARRLAITPSYVNYTFDDRSCFESFSRNEQYFIVQCLIDYGVDVHLHDDLMLRKASKIGNLPLVQFLIEKGASVTGVKSNTCALFEAIYGGHLELVQYLLPFLEDHHWAWYESVDEAATRGFFTILVHLIENSPIGIDDADKYYSLSEALLWAASGGHLQIVKHLVAQDADLIEYDDALHRAVENGHVDIVKFLVEHGADVNAYRYDRKAPLDLAETREIIDYLIEHGAMRTL